MTLKRLFDVSVASIALAVLAIPMLFIAVAVRVTSPGPALYWSDRVGRNNVLFKMPKFRSMYVTTPAIATHLLPDARSHLTPIGPLLRRASLDELPQLWSILTGHMSLVGPRPALFNQHDLVKLRTSSGVHVLVPGLTGWAQINGRDELNIEEKVRLDAEYFRNRSFILDCKILVSLWSCARRKNLPPPQIEIWDQFSVFMHNRDP
jgi:O-antigen biosynthesis protein WbqP